MQIIKSLAQNNNKFSFVSAIEKTSAPHRNLFVSDQAAASFPYTRSFRFFPRYHYRKRGMVTAGSQNRLDYSKLDASTAFKALFCR